jgi:hypothetical protein
MALLALAAPTVYLPDPTYTTFVLPAGTSPGANTGFTFPNNPAGLVYAVINMGSTVVTATVVSTLAGTSNITALLTISVPNFIGPFDPAKYSSAAGLVTINLSVVTGITGVAAVIMSASVLNSYRALHNPFEMTAGAQDS